MTILVTGCMGFIGSNLVPLLLRAGHYVIGFDNLSNPSIAPTDRMKARSEKYWKKFKFYKVNIGAADHMQTFLMNERAPDVVIHLAAVGSVPRSFSYPIDTIHNNCTGFASMMYTARMFGVKKFIYASSSSVYGNNKDLYKMEGLEGEALSPYALSKQMNEKFAKVWGAQQGIHCIGLRFFNVYGPGQRPDGAYASVIPRFINNEKPVVYGDGTATRDFTYVDDVCEAIEKCLKLSDKGEKHVVMNVGAGWGTRVKHLLTLLGKEKVAEYKEERRGDIKTSIASTVILKSILDYTPPTKIEEGILKTKAYYDSLKSNHGQGKEDGK